MIKSWYAFIGGDDVFNPMNYIRLTNGSKHICLCGDKICAVYLPDNGRHPQSPISDNLQNYITNALVSGQLQPQIPWASKKYVYLRSSV